MTEAKLLKLLAKAAAQGYRELDLSYNGLSTLPPEVGQLVNLESLDLSGNELIAVPPEISNLGQLRHLDLRRNLLTGLPVEIGMLSQLISLDVRQNQLSALPREFESLQQLQSLDLRQNNFRVFPQSVLALSRLAELHIWQNPLLSIPLEIGELRNLTMLNMGGNAMSEIPPGIWELENLRHLIIEHTELTEIPPEITRLSRLEYVEFHNNRLMTLPSEFGSLSNLLAVILHHNYLVKLPEELGALRRLRRLDLHNNQLISLPQSIHALKALEVLDVSHNPLPIPPEVTAWVREPAALISYYIDHQKGPKRPLNEAKLILVGQGNVGKTSVRRRLMENEFNPMEPKTQGIEIESWTTQVNSADIKLNVWDFGGQEIMHATHQFFLTKRTLYILVLDTRLSEAENRLEYWLHIIHSFGGNSPVIVVGNKIDQQALDIDRRGLQSKFPQVKAVMETSCVTGDGIDRLCARITREVSHMPHVKDELLLSWFEIKRQLEALDKDYIPYDSYLDMCVGQGVVDEESQRTLIGFLHDLGIVLNFQDDARLGDTSILNPEWVTNAVYRILNDKVLLQRQGELEQSDLVRILDRKTYPRHKHQFILDIMRKFELCFVFDGVQESHYLIPDLLSKEAPPLGEWQDALAFDYHYNFLPSSVISRFIVRIHPYIQGNIHWRSGVIVTDQDNEALVIADIATRRIHILVKGLKYARRDLLSIIRSHFDSIHKTIPGMQVWKKIPLPGYPDIAVDYEYLLDLEAMGERSFVPPGLRQRIDVKLLLNGIDLAEGRKKPVQLRQVLIERFDWEELETLSYDLDVDFQRLKGNSKASKARELIAYLSRRERLDDLIKMGKSLRPDIIWDDP
ncbi:MAG: COR domain-containing protein [Anaerolineae bacterium]|nr:COR domain-containing protein [Anaerolineae bacterium]